MDSDKVAFLDNGKLVEYGEPHELLKSKVGRFTALVSGSGSKRNEDFARPRRDCERFEDATARSRRERERPMID